MFINDELRKSRFFQFVTPYKKSEFATLGNLLFKYRCLDLGLLLAGIQTLFQKRRGDHRAGGVDRQKACIRQVCTWLQPSMNMH